MHRAALRGATRRRPAEIDRATAASRMRTVLALLVVLLPLRVHAGYNAGAGLGLVMNSEPCGVAGGEVIQFTLVARGMHNVRLVKLRFDWDPADAVSTVVGQEAGLAQEHSFFVPGPMLLQGNRAEFGMAAFSDSMSGDGAIARFSFRLADDLPAGTPVDICLLHASLGTAFTERDTLTPDQKLILSNYCDASGQPVEAGIFLRPQNAMRPVSAHDQAAVADGSSGEALFLARVLRAEAPVADQPVTWEVSNSGPVDVYVHQAADVLHVTPGMTAELVTRTDPEGAVRLTLDAAAEAPALVGSARLRACTEGEFAPRCATADVTWQAHPTAVTEPPAHDPREICLSPPSPNPFNAGTAILLHVGTNCQVPVAVTVHDILGQQLSVLASGLLPAGDHLLRWDGRDDRGRLAGTGVYYCQLRQRGRRQVVSLLLLR